MIYITLQNIFYDLDGIIFIYIYIISIMSAILLKVNLIE